MTNKENTAIVLREESLRSLIYTVRGRQVMLDRDLAGLYLVDTCAQTGGKKEQQAVS